MCMGCGGGRGSWFMYHALLTMCTQHMGGMRRGRVYRIAGVITSGRMLPKFRSSFPTHTIPSPDRTHLLLRLQRGAPPPPVVLHLPD
jgi:hypothetical protein